MSDGISQSDLDELELLRSIVAESPVVIYAKDTALRFVLSNAMHAGLLQLPSSEIVGRTDADLFGDQAAPVDEASRKVLSSGIPSIDEFSLTLPEGQRVFHETLFRLGDEQGVPIGIGGIATDITRRIELEREVRAKNAHLQTTLQELQRTRAAAQEAERMASLGNLVAGLGHEVNTPLSVASISMTVAAEEAELLRMKLGESGPRQKDAEASVAKILDSVRLAEEQIARLSTLMSSFREVAVDRVHIELRNTSLQGWLHVAAQTLTPVCRQHGVRLDWRVEGDRELRLAVGALHQVVTNLVVNACVHAFDGVDGPREVALYLEGNDEGLILRVDDNGRGISGEVANRLFEPFFTTRRGTGGSGLGLHIVYNMVVGTLGGTVRHENRSEGGSRFEVRIPYRTTTAIQPEQEVVEVVLNPELPRALWAAFVSDLRKQATTLRRAPYPEQRARIYGQLVGSLGIYGLNRLAEEIRLAEGSPESPDRALQISDSLMAHADAIEDQLESFG